MTKVRKITNKKRFILVAAFCLLFIGIISATSACRQSGSIQQVQVADTLEKVRSSKELHVGYFIFEPTIMKDPNGGQPRGVFIDMVESIAKSLDAKVVYHEVDLANFAAGLQSRQYDLSIGATFATPQRATAVLFTRPIFYAGYTGVVKKGQAGNFPDWQSMDRPNLRVAVKQGSAIDDFVRENFKNAQIVRLTGADLTLPLTAVASGQADVGLMNQLTVFTFLREHPELEEVLSTNPVAPTNFAWAVRPDDFRWLMFLNTAIEYMEDTGETYRYESKYGIPLLHAKQEWIFPDAARPGYWQYQETKPTQGK